MNKKVGKFKLWQLIAAGVAIGVIFYIYSKGKGEGASPEEMFGGTGTGAFGPIDPETGVPYAFEGGSGGGAGSAPGGGLAETLGIINGLKEAGLWPEQGEREPSAPEREEVVVEKEGPEPRTNAEVDKARLATHAARKAEHKAMKEANKAKAKAHRLEHKKTQKHNKTGDSAHTPHNHGAKGHPAGKVNNAKNQNRQRSDANRSTHHTNNQQNRRNNNNGGGRRGNGGGNHQQHHQQQHHR